MGGSVDVPSAQMVTITVEFHGYQPFGDTMVLSVCMKQQCTNTFDHKTEI